MTMSSFRQAVEAEDYDAVVASLAEDVTFTSPVAFAPYEGKAITAAILRAVIRVFQDFHYVREITSADGRDQALVFRAKVGELDIHGCDFLHLDAEGKVDDLQVMVRPLNAAKALAEAMGAEFERITREAAEG